jgi:cold shock CspA family protein
MITLPLGLPNCGQDLPLGQGLCSRDDGNGKIFVHISNCAEDIEELVQGQRVRFDEQTSKRSGQPAAIAVELL